MVAGADNHYAAFIGDPDFFLSVFGSRAFYLHFVLN